MCLKSKWLMLILGLIFATLHRKWWLLSEWNIFEMDKATGFQSIIQARLSICQYMLASCLKGYSFVCWSDWNDKHLFKMYGKANPVLKMLKRLLPNCYFWVFYFLMKRNILRVCKLHYSDSKDSGFNFKASDRTDLSR